jgi:hemerythrin
MLTGVAEVDAQHRILVDTLVDARASLAGATSAEPFEALTQDLLAYAIYHFDTEERLMREHGYAAVFPVEAAAHLEQHRRFTAEVVRRRGEARQGSAEAHAALLEFLEDWLVSHILTVDQRLGAFVGPRRSR